MRRSLLRVTIALAVLATTLSAAQGARAETQVDTTRFFLDPATLPFNALAGTTTSRYWGTSSHGAGWQIEVPSNWNGDLVLYAHGYAGEGAQLFVSPPAFIRPYLIANGYAWAASSYRANGYVPGVGAEDTNDLVKIFKDTVRTPGGKKAKVNAVYLYGVSMGGHIVGNMIEKWRNSFVGALPICGVMGDNELFDFFQDLYLVAETLVGNVPIVPTPADYYTNPAMGWQVTRTKLGTPYPTVLTATGTLFKQIVENLSGGDRPVYDQGFVGPNGGDFAFNFGSAVASPGRENLETVYQFDTDPALSAAERQFNDAIVRIAADTQVRDRDGIFTTTTSSPALTAKFKIPVVTMHTLGDLFVPFSMEQIYARRAIEAGTSDLLVQRAIRGRGHCEFAAAEVSTAFGDLVKWVVQGVKPEGDDLLDPATVAAPDFGCKFTPATHGPLVPPCQ